MVCGRVYECGYMYERGRVYDNACEFGLVGCVCCHSIHGDCMSRTSALTEEVPEVYSPRIHPTSHRVTEEKFHFAGLVAELCVVPLPPLGIGKWSTGDANSCTTPIHHGSSSSQ